MATDQLLAPPVTLHTSVCSLNHSQQDGSDMLQSHHHESPNSESENLTPTTTYSEPCSSSTLLSPSSPTAKSFGGDTLRCRADSFNSVVGSSRSRADSFNSKAETARSRANSDLTTLRSRFEGDDLTIEEALRPDRNNEKDFQVENNPFAFSPGQLNKNLNPKSLAAFRALGGIFGLERGLRTDLVAGLSVDETTLDGKVSFQEATESANSQKPLESRRIIVQDVIVTDREINGQYHDRKRVFKDNRLPAKKPISIWRLFWNAYNDRVLLILTAAAAISLALGIYEAVGQPPDPEGGASLDWVEGLAIIVAIVVVVLVTGLNDYRRERQFSALNARKDDRQVKAIRSGKSVMISVYDVTVGDILHLESGDSIPADGILVGGHGIRCDESSATGESDAMKKTGGPEVWQRLVDGTATSKLDPFIISGSKVLEGVGTYLVTSVGVNSSFGKIMMGLQAENEETPLQVKLARMANWIGYLGTSAAGLLFFILTIRFLAGLSGNTDTPAKRGQSFLDILIVAITIIVVAVPEGLPVAVTLALSFATKKMFKENNLVRHLRACETMGNATTICSDKTGTLTQNKMTVVAGLLGTEVNFARDVDLDDEDKTVLTFAAAFGRLSSTARNLLLQSVAINSTAFEGEEDGKATYIGSKTETALLTLAKENLGMGPVAEERAGVEIVQLFPFDSDRKCMGVVIRLASGVYRLLVKGAAEIMLDKATSEITDVSAETLGIDELSETSRSKASANIDDFATQSLRTIAMLYKDFQQWPPSGVQTLEDDKHMAKFEDVCQEMIFLGVVGIQDPLREGVSRAVQRCQDAGIVVRMVTGDNITTASAIAKQCGIITDKGRIMEGPSFRQLSDDDMNKILPDLQVLARSSPEDKRILVTKLKQLGETVAVTGDGTNDGPALKMADVGFSMGLAGTEVAKEASAIILLDDNFSSIVKAVMWGRSVNDAVAKFLQFQITVNITAVILAFVSAVASKEMHSVLSAVQLLWVNLIMDTFAALALATDPPTEKILDRKPTPKRAPLITTNMWKMIIGQAIYQLLVTLVLYFVGYDVLGYDTKCLLQNQRGRCQNLMEPQLGTCLVDESRKCTDLMHKQLNTMVFNTFVWMQIFNEFNNRRLDNKFNIFEGVLRNYFFIGINCIMVGGQVMIIFVGGAAFDVKRIDGTQWVVCILCALPCLLWAVVIRCIPDSYAALVFGTTAKIWLYFARPVMQVLRVIFRPVAKGCRALSNAVFAPAWRFSKRTVSKISKKKAKEDGETHASATDEEAGTNVEMTTALNAPQTSVELPMQPPPITLTTPT
ncbi:MAG: hypothetical protein LQ351_006986 [Letrouitia transgressa]|nr:MAG: hypothetical protein LQ351_006986 [Letrouitia transgressa]